MKTLFGVAFGIPLAIVIVFFLILGSFIVAADKAPSAAAVVAAQPTAPSSLDLAGRASDADIIAACGKPERNWLTIANRGEAETQTRHLWYSRIPVEIQIVSWPESAEEQMRHWTYGGAWRSLDADAPEYEAAKLVVKMPCMKRWTDAWQEAVRENAAAMQNVR